MERMIERGRRETRVGVRRGSIESILSEDDMRSLLLKGEGEVTGTEDEDGIETDADVGTTGDETDEEKEKDGLLLDLKGAM